MNTEPTKYIFRCKLASEGGRWVWVMLDDLPRSCGCDGDLSEWLTAALEEQGHTAPQIDTVRRIRHLDAVGVVTMYLCEYDQSYGGAEEGGWYYDSSRVRRTFTVPVRSYRRHRDRLERYCEAANGPRKEWQTRRRDGDLYVSTYEPCTGPRPHYC